MYQVTLRMVIQDEMLISLNNLNVIFWSFVLRATGYQQNLVRWIEPLNFFLYYIR